MTNRSFFPLIRWRTSRPVLPLVFLCSVALCLLTLFWLTTSLYAEPKQPDGLGSLAGQVRDENGQPLAGIQVTLWVLPPYSSLDSWWYSRLTTTEADGSYRFGALPPGIYRVSANDPAKRYGQRFYPTARTVQGAQDLLVTGNFVTGINLTLQPAGRIIVNVMTTPAYTLTYTGIELRQQITTTGGVYWERLYAADFTVNNQVYTFTGVAANTYRVCAYGYGPKLSAYECYDNVYDVDAATDLPLHAGGTISNVTILFGDGANYGQIKGRVTATTDGKPLTGIQVYAYRVNENVVARAAGSRFGHGTATTTLATAPLMMNNDYYGYLQAVSDVNGDYTLATVPAGRYQLYFVDPAGNYALEYYDNQWRIDGSAIIKVAAQAVISPVNNQLVAAGRISGIVTLADQPTPDTNVLAERKTDDGVWFPIAQVKSNPNTGAYTIGGLPAGIYRISAQAQMIDYTSANYSVYFPYGVYGGATLAEATEITLTSGQSVVNSNIALNGLRYESALSGRITANGQPISGAKVGLYLPGGCCSYGAPAPRLYTFTDVAGRYTFQGLGSGSFVLGVSDPAGIYATTYYSNQVSPLQARLVYLNEDQKLYDYNVDLPRAGAIRGLVQQRTQKPVAGLYITLFSLDTPPYSFIGIPTESRTDNSGRYTITGLHPGRYYVCFNRAEYPSRSECYGQSETLANFGMPVTVTVGVTTTDVDLLWGPDLPFYLPLISKQ